MKRFLDILLSIILIIVLSPLFVVIYLLIIAESKGGGIYRQKRIGKNGKEFQLLKFRSMYVDADKKGLLTVGSQDNRITRVGRFIRKYKLDELPQLFNVLAGQMSFVGPRPEVKKYVDLYTPQQRRILNVKPGITDYASIEFIDENDILAKSPNPEQTYIEEIMPQKIELNMKYIENPTIGAYLKIIFLTFLKIFRR